MGIVFMDIFLWILLFVDIVIGRYFFIKLVVYKRYCL